eukprot:scaffold73738_cov49-Attheya_sp.AAC.1
MTNSGVVSDEDEELLEEEGDGWEDEELFSDDDDNDNEDDSTNNLEDIPLDSSNPSSLHKDHDDDVDIDHDKPRESAISHDATLPPSTAAAAAMTEPTRDASPVPDDDEQEGSAWEEEDDPFDSDSDGNIDNAATTQPAVSFAAAVAPPPPPRLVEEEEEPKIGLTLGGGMFMGRLVQLLDHATKTTDNNEEMEEEKNENAATDPNVSYGSGWDDDPLEDFDNDDIQITPQESPQLASASFASLPDQDTFDNEYDDDDTNDNKNDAVAGPLGRLQEQEEDDDDEDKMSMPATIVDNATLMVQQDTFDDEYDEEVEASNSAPMGQDAALTMEKQDTFDDEYEEDAELTMGKQDTFDDEYDEDVMVPPPNSQDAFDNEYVDVPQYQEEEEVGNYHPHQQQHMHLDPMQEIEEEDDDTTSCGDEEEPEDLAIHADTNNVASLSLPQNTQVEPVGLPTSTDVVVVVVDHVPLSEPNPNHPRVPPQRLDSQMAVADPSDSYLEDDDIDNETDTPLNEIPEESLSMVVNHLPSIRPLPLERLESQRAIADVTHQEGWEDDDLDDIDDNADDGNQHDTTLNEMPSEEEPEDLAIHADTNNVTSFSIPQNQQVEPVEPVAATDVVVVVDHVPLSEPNPNHPRVPPQRLDSQMAVADPSDSYLKDDDNDNETDTINELTEESLSMVVDHLPSSIRPLPLERLESQMAIADVTQQEGWEDDDLDDIDNDADGNQHDTTLNEMPEESISMVVDHLPSSPSSRPSPPKRLDSQMAIADVTQQEGWEDDDLDDIDDNDGNQQDTTLNEMPEESISMVVDHLPSSPSSRPLPPKRLNSQMAIADVTQQEGWEDDDLDDIDDNAGGNQHDTTLNEIPKESLSMVVDHLPSIRPLRLKRLASQMAIPDVTHQEGWEDDDLDDIDDDDDDELLVEDDAVESTTDMEHVAALVDHVPPPPSYPMTKRMDSQLAVTAESQCSESLGNIDEGWAEEDSGINGLDEEEEEKETHSGDHQENLATEPDSKPPLLDHSRVPPQPLGSQMAVADASDSYLKDDDNDNDGNDNETDTMNEIPDESLSMVVDHLPSSRPLPPKRLESQMAIADVTHQEGWEDDDLDDIDDDNDGNQHDTTLNEMPEESLSMVVDHLPSSHPLPPKELESQMAIADVTHQEGWEDDDLDDIDADDDELLVEDDAVENTTDMENDAALVDHVPPPPSYPMTKRMDSQLAVAAESQCSESLGTIDEGGWAEEDNLCLDEEEEEKETHSGDHQENLATEPDSKPTLVDHVPPSPPPSYTMTKRPDSQMAVAAESQCSESLGTIDEGGWAEGDQQENRATEPDSKPSLVDHVPPPPSYTMTKRPDSQMAVAAESQCSESLGTIDEGGWAEGDQQENRATEPDSTPSLVDHVPPPPSYPMLKRLDSQMAVAAESQCSESLGNIDEGWAEEDDASLVDHVPPSRSVTERLDSDMSVAAESQCSGSERNGWAEDRGSESLDVQESASEESSSAAAPSTPPSKPTSLSRNGEEGTTSVVDHLPSAHKMDRNDSQVAVADLSDYYDPEMGSLPEEDGWNEGGYSDIDSVPVPVGYEAEPNTVVDDTNIPARSVGNIAPTSYPEPKQPENGWDDDSEIVSLEEMNDDVENASVDTPEQISDRQASQNQEVELLAKVDGLLGTPRVDVQAAVADIMDYYNSDVGFLLGNDGWEDKDDLTELDDGVRANATEAKGESSAMNGLDGQNYRELLFGSSMSDDAGTAISTLQLEDYEINGSHSKAGHMCLVHVEYIGDSSLRTDCPCIAKVLCDLGGNDVNGMATTPDGINVQIDFKKLLQNEMTKRLLVERELVGCHSLINSFKSTTRDGVSLASERQLVLEKNTLLLARQIKWLEKSKTDLAHELSQVEKEHLKRNLLLADRSTLEEMQSKVEDERYLWCQREEQYKQQILELKETISPLVGKSPGEATACVEELNVLRQDVSALELQKGEIQAEKEKLAAKCSQLVSCLLSLDTSRVDHEPEPSPLGAEEVDSLRNEVESLVHAFREDMAVVVEEKNQLAIKNTELQSLVENFESEEKKTTLADKCAELEEQISQMQSDSSLNAIDMHRKFREDMAVVVHENNRISARNEELESLTPALDTMENENQILITKCKELQEQLAQVQSEYLQKNNVTQDQFREDMTDILSEKEKVDKEKHALATRCADLEERLVDIQKQSAQKVDQINDELHNDLSAFDEEKTRLLIRVEELESIVHKIDGVEEEKQRVAKRCMDLEEKLTRIQKESSQRFDEMHDRLHEEMAVVLDEKNQLIIKIEELESLAYEKDGTDKESQRLGKRCSELEERLTQTKHDSSERFDEMRSKLHKDIAVVMEEKNKMLITNTKLESQVNEMSGVVEEKKRLSIKCAELEEAVIKVQNESSRKIDEMKDTFHEDVAKFSEEKSKLSIKVEEYDTLLHKIAGVEEEKKRLSKRCVDLEERLVRVQKESSERFDAMHDRLRDDVVALLEEKKQLTARNEDLETLSYEKDGVDKEKLRLVKRCSEIEERLAKVQKESSLRIDKMSNKLRMETSALVEEKDKLSIAKQELESLTREREGL